MNIIGLITLQLCLIIACIDAAEVSTILNPDPNPPKEEAPPDGFKDDNGNDLVEGDMVIPKDKDGADRNAVISDNKKWPKAASGTVDIAFVWDFEGSGGEPTAKAKQAFDDYRNFTCINFVPKKDEEHYIRFFKGSGCYSFVGVTGAKAQDVSLGWCSENKGVIQHEIMHALGFHHEQSRPDRDEHVTVHMENIEDSYKNNFRKCDSAACTTQGLPYDYNSVIHYGQTYCTKNGEDTIVPKVAGAKIGQRLGLSTLDVAKIQKLYKCTQTVNQMKGTGQELKDQASWCPEYASWCKDNDYVQKYCQKTCAQ